MELMTTWNILNYSYCRININLYSFFFSFRRFAKTRENKHMQHSSWESSSRHMSEFGLFRCSLISTFPWRRARLPSTRRQPSSPSSKRSSSFHRCVWRDQTGRGKVSPIWDWCKCWSRPRDPPPSSGYNRRISQQDSRLHFASSPL